MRDEKIIRPNASDIYDWCIWLDQQPDEKVLWLIESPPWGRELLEHATYCEKCGNRIYRATETMFDRLSAAEKESYEVMAARFIKRNSLQDNSSSATNISEELPAEIVSAGRLIGLYGQRLLDNLLGFSKTDLKPIQAASGMIELTVDLDRFRGGAVTLELEDNGHGILQGHFDFPEMVRACVYDTSAKRVLPIAEEGEQYSDFLKIDSGVTVKSIQVKAPDLESALANLHLIILKA